MLIRNQNQGVVSKEKLYGKTLNELVSVAKKEGLPGYSAKQMADWLYRKEINSVDEMTNLSKKMREKISADYEIGLSAPASVSESRDGTKKYLFKVLSGKYIESAFIPGKNRATLCVSSQAGCRMACIFCMTGRQHFQGNLSSNEILNQFRSIPEFSILTNIVFMGMGEPLDNTEEVLKSLEILTAEWGYGWSPTRITLSTIGLKNRIREFLEKSRCHLAVSLHSPFDAERARLMPVQKSSRIKEVIDIVREYDFPGQRRISFEYILFSGLNDTPAHVRELARLINGLKCRINIIRFHEIPGTELKSPGQEEAERFRDALNKKGIPATVRVSRGEDIGAACGLLSTLEQNTNKK